MLLAAITRCHRSSSIFLLSIQTTKLMFQGWNSGSETATTDMLQQFWNYIAGTIMPSAAGLAVVGAVANFVQRKPYARRIFAAIGFLSLTGLFHLIPPYDSEIGSMDSKRMEYLFLEHMFRWLVEGGVLLMVVAQERLDSAIPLLAGNFTDLRLFRLTDPESERFDQVALFGVRKRMRGEHYDRNRALLVEMVWRHQLPVLTGAETPYRVPPSTPAPLVYRGLPLDQIEDVILTSSTWRQVAPFLLPKEEVQDGRPITPFHAGHVGLLCTAGLLNGVFGQGRERHIARWRTVKSVTVFEVKENGFREIHKRERFTNELALIYEDGHTLLLGEEKKKEDCDAECTPPPGPASVHAEYGEDQYADLGPH
jgi:Uncharacterised methyltransferase family (DUF6094)